MNDNPIPAALAHVEIYTDGACEPNPGPGGYGVVLVHPKKRAEASGGFRKTTNNRMEIFAAIAGLEMLKQPCQVTVYGDSRYNAGHQAERQVETEPRLLLRVRLVLPELRDELPRRVRQAVLGAAALIVLAAEPLGSSDRRCENA